MSLTVSIKWHDINWQIELVLLNSCDVVTPKQAAAAGPTSLYFVRVFGFGLCDLRLNLWLFHSIWQSTSSDTASWVELHVRVHDQYYA